MTNGKPAPLPALPGVNPEDFTCLDSRRADNSIPLPVKLFDD